MEIKDVIEKILPYAPTVAAVLGGPYTAVAVKLLSTAIGSKNNSISEILDTLSTSPNIKVQLEQLEFDFDKYKLQISANDTANARQSDVEKEKFGKKSYMPEFITIFLMIIFSIMLYLLFSAKDANLPNSPLIGSMVGLLTREFIQACRFYIGGDGESS